MLSDYPRLSQQRKLIASVVVAGFDRVKIATWPGLNFETSIESFMHNFGLAIVNIFYCHPHPQPSASASVPSPSTVLLLRGEAFQRFRIFALHAFLPHLE